MTVAQFLQVHPDEEYAVNLEGYYARSIIEYLRQSRLLANRTNIW